MKESEKNDYRKKNISDSPPRYSLQELLNGHSNEFLFGPQNILFCESNALNIP
jgi:hypothetical protein